MKLNKLLFGINVKRIIGNQGLDINDVVIDSNKATQNSLFVCINGNDNDGHFFVDKAINYGCVAIVCERELDVSVTQIIVDNSRECMAIMASNFYDNVDKKLKLVAVIGTNGKTTTSHMIKGVLDNCNVNCGVIGTLGTYYDNKYFERIFNH